MYGGTRSICMYAARSSKRTPDMQTERKIKQETRREVGIRYRDVIFGNKMGYQVPGGRR